MPVTYDLQRMRLRVVTVLPADNVCGSTGGGPSGTEIKKAVKKIEED
jgi:hypothetical protein